MMSMRLLGSAAVVLVATVMLHADAQAQRPGLRARPALMRDIEDLFVTQVSRTMGLNPDQAPRFQRIVRAWAQKRATLESEERSLRQGLNGELKPGVAANPDSVGYYVDALNSNRVAYAETFRDEMRELTPILSPVQRGQFQQARDRLLQRVRQLQDQRAAAPPDQP